MPSEERLKVLKMVEDGKISAEDAVELLMILEESAGRKSQPQAAQAGPSTAGGIKDNRWFRVRITDTDSGKTRVNVRLPINMVNAGIKMGMRFAPEVEGMDIGELMQYIQTGEVGQIVDVFDDEDGEHIEVFIE
jgi:hypothetical protein